jgi:hypothetical protein
MGDERWLTKREAADRLGVDERTIERKARAGLLGSETRPGFPTRYNPRDVEELAQATGRGHRPAILPADQAVPSNGNGAGHAGRRELLGIEQVLGRLLEHLEARRAIGPTGPTRPTDRSDRSDTVVPLERREFLTVAEAVALAGLPRGQVRTAPGWIGRGRGLRIHRLDLRAFCRGLRATP